MTKLCLDKKSMRVWKNVIFIRHKIGFPTQSRDNPDLRWIPPRCGGWQQNKGGSGRDLATGYFYTQYVKWSEVKWPQNPAEPACVLAKACCVAAHGQDFTKTRGCCLNWTRYHGIPWNDWSKPRKVSFTIASNLSQIRTYYRQNTKLRRYLFNIVTRPPPSGMHPMEGLQSGLDVLMKRDSGINFQPWGSER